MYLIGGIRRNIKIGNQKKVIGVTYSSSKFVCDEKYFGHFNNTAIPVFSTVAKGFCNMLGRQFRVTKPLNFNEALTCQVDVTQTMQIRSIHFNGSEVPYVETDFGKIEAVLCKDPYNKLEGIIPY